MAVVSEEDIKIGRRVVAKLSTLDGGAQVVTVKRSLKDVVLRKGIGLISHGIEEDTAAWPVETYILTRMKRQGIPFLIIDVKETKERYVSRLDSWIEEATVYYKRRRNGSSQHILTFPHFERRQRKRR